MKALSWLFLSSILFIAVAAVAAEEPVIASILNKPKLPMLRTVEHVDLASYLGRWYELATIPKSFEKVCTARATAEYSLLPNGSIRVLNTCDNKFGHRVVADGRAVITDKNSNAKLKVTFLHALKHYFFRLLGINVSGQYWVVELGPDYSYSIVGHPSRTYAWVLSRHESLSLDTWRHIEAVLRSESYDTCSIISTIQDDGIKTRTPLCELVK